MGKGNRGAFCITEETMDKKQWIRSTLAHVQPSEVPYHFMFTPPVEAKLRAYYGTEDVARALGFPIFLKGCKDKPLYADPAIYGEPIVDAFGVVWSTNAIDRGSPIVPALREPSSEEVRFPDPDDPKRYEGVREAFARRTCCLMDRRRRCGKRCCGRGMAWPKKGGIS